jgi:hypothetical protein
LARRTIKLAVQDGWHGTNCACERLGVGFFRFRRRLSPAVRRMSTAATNWPGLAAVA